MLFGLQQELSKKCFVVDNVDPEVLMVKNFISDSELNEILDIIQKSKQEDWEIEYKENLKRFCMEKFGTDDVDKLVSEGKFEITQNWNDKNLNILNTKVQKNIYNRLESFISMIDNNLELSGFATIQRMQSGVELKSHIDQNTDPSIRYATILYLNEDYNDGEIFFPKLNINLKPQKKSMLIFPGTEKYEHGVTHVGNGPTRYVLVGFIKVKNFYDKIKY